MQLQTTNPTIQLTIEETQSFAAAVKAAAHGASTDAARPLLTGIKLYVSAEEIKAVATDSYRLHIATVRITDGPEQTREYVIDAKQLVAAMPKAREFCSLELGDRDLTVHSPAGSSSTKLTVIEGTYPDWQNLIKDEKQTEPFEVALNPKLMESIGKAAHIFRGKTDVPLRFIPGQSPMKPMYFEMDVIDRGNFFALLMPVRIP